MQDIRIHFQTHWNHEPTSMASTCNSRATWWMVFHLAIEITSNQTFRLQNALFGGPLKHTRIQVMYHTLNSFCFKKCISLWLVVHFLYYFYITMIMWVSNSNKLNKKLSLFYLLYFTHGKQHTYTNLAFSRNPIHVVSSSCH